jgi:hypothetical protein
LTTFMSHCGQTGYSIHRIVQPTAGTPSREPHGQSKKLGTVKLPRIHANALVKERPDTRPFRVRRRGSSNVLPTHRVVNSPPGIKNAAGKIGVALAPCRGSETPPAAAQRCPGGKGGPGVWLVEPPVSGAPSASAAPVAGRHGAGVFPAGRDQLRAGGAFWGGAGR